MHANVIVDNFIGLCACMLESNLYEGKPVRVRMLVSNGLSKNDDVMLGVEWSMHYFGFTIDYWVKQA